MGNFGFKDIEQLPSRYQNRLRQPYLRYVATNPITFLFFGSPCQQRDLSDIVVRIIWLRSSIYTTTYSDTVLTNKNRDKEDIKLISSLSRFWLVNTVSEYVVV